MKFKKMMYILVFVVICGLFIFASVTVLPIVLKNYDDSIKYKIFTEAGDVYKDIKAVSSSNPAANENDPLLGRYLSAVEAKTKPKVREASSGEITLEKAVELDPTKKLVEAGIIPTFTRPIEEYSYNAILLDYSQTDYRYLVNSLWYVEVTPKDKSAQIKDGPIYIKYYLDSVSGKLCEIEYAYPIGLRKEPATRFSIMDNTYCNIMSIMFAKFCGIDVTMMTKVMEVKSGTASSVYLDSSGLIRISASQGVTTDGDEVWKLSLIDTVTTSE